MERRVVFQGWLFPAMLLLPQLAVTIVFFFWPAGQAIFQSLLREDAYGNPVPLPSRTALAQNTVYRLRFQVPQGNILGRLRDRAFGAPMLNVALQGKDFEVVRVPIVRSFSRLSRGVGSASTAPAAIGSAGARSASDGGVTVSGISAMLAPAMRRRRRSAAQPAV